jgi:Ran GTPase-activating protein (RanGAP) involved in mRNA processing and transport
MNHCRLGEDGAYYISEGLTKNRKLRTLLLSNNNIFDEGLISLGQTVGMSSLGLEHLDVSNNSINNEGVIDFARNLAENRALITLNLKQN